MAHNPEKPQQPPHPLEALGGSLAGLHLQQNSYRVDSIRNSFLAGDQDAATAAMTEVKTVLHEAEVVQTHLDAAAKAIFQRLKYFPEMRQTILTQEGIESQPSETITRNVLPEAVTTVLPVSSTEAAVAEPPLGFFVEEPIDQNGVIVAEIDETLKDEYLTPIQIETKLVVEDVPEQTVAAPQSTDSTQDVPLMTPSIEVEQPEVVAAPTEIDAATVELPPVSTEVASQATVEASSVVEVVRVGEPIPEDQSQEVVASSPEPLAEINSTPVEHEEVDLGNMNLNDILDQIESEENAQMTADETVTSITSQDAPMIHTEVEVPLEVKKLQAPDLSLSRRGQSVIDAMWITAGGEEMMYLETASQIWPDEFGKTDDKVLISRIQVAVSNIRQQLAQKGIKIERYLDEERNVNTYALEFSKKAAREYAKEIAEAKAAVKAQKEAVKAAKNSVKTVESSSVQRAVTETSETSLVDAPVEIESNTQALSVETVGDIVVAETTTTVAETLSQPDEDVMPANVPAVSNEELVETAVDGSVSVTAEPVEVNQIAETVNNSEAPAEEAFPVSGEIQFAIQNDESNIRTPVVEGAISVSEAEPVVENAEKVVPSLTTADMWKFLDALKNELSSMDIEMLERGGVIIPKAFKQVDSFIADNKKIFSTPQARQSFQFNQGEWEKKMLQMADNMRATMLAHVNNVELQGGLFFTAGFIKELSDMEAILDRLPKRRSM